MIKITQIFSVHCWILIIKYISQNFSPITGCPAQTFQKLFDLSPTIKEQTMFGNCRCLLSYPGLAPPSLTSKMASNIGSAVQARPILGQLKHQLLDLGPLPPDHEMCRWITAAKVSIVRKGLFRFVKKAMTYSIFFIGLSLPSPKTCLRALLGQKWQE